ARMIMDAAHPDANNIWGVSFDPTLEDEMRITITATGFDGANAAAKKRDYKTVTASRQPNIQEKTAELEPDEEPAEEVLNEEVFEDVTTMLKRRAAAPQAAPEQTTQPPVSPRFGRRFS
ncbi:MAG: hypothetical protein IKM09_02630, partial [Clostridia bacterium]|nr:hypothetical protein [Clostridia bacterium]